jgi:hypothetical protein
MEAAIEKAISFDLAICLVFQQHKGAQNVMV